MKVAILFTSLILFGASIGYAQTKPLSSAPKSATQNGWRIFSPPDKSFKVETLVSLSRIDDMYGETSPDGYKAIDVWGGESKSEGGFLIVVLTPSEEMRSKHPNDNEIGGLEFVIGGDDAKPLSEKAIIMRGLKGKEFTYDLSRGQILDAGERIFILVYAGKSAKDLSSPSATKFFDSFQSMLKKRNTS